MTATPPDAEKRDRSSEDDRQPPEPLPVNPLERQDGSAGDREAVLAHELPEEWVAELQRPVAPYETPLDGLVEASETEPEPEGRQGAEARKRARRAAERMEELSRGLTLDGLSIREMIGRDRR